MLSARNWIKSSTPCSSSTSGCSSGTCRIGLVQVEMMHRKSLEIEEKLGRLEGMASDYGNLGLIYETRGDLKEARTLWTRARDLYEKIGMEHMVAKIQNWLDDLP